MPGSEICSRAILDYVGSCSAAKATGTSIISRAASLRCARCSKRSGLARPACVPAPGSAPALMLESFDLVTDFSGDAFEKHQLPHGFGGRLIGTGIEQHRQPLEASSFLVAQLVLQRY